MELGSEYNLDPSGLTYKEDNLFQYLKDYEHLYFYDSGRSAIRQAVFLIGSERPVLMPEYICESVIHCFSKENVSFYRIHEDFTIDIEDLQGRLRKNSIIFLMHYFGKLQPFDTLKKIQKLASQNECIIIEDTTHSIFSAARTIGDYMVCSLRKWMPISRGGILYMAGYHPRYSSVKLRKSDDNKRITGFILKDLFLKGKLDCNNEYRNIFRESEDEIDKTTEVMLLSDLNRFIVQCVSIGNLIRRRKANAAYLLAGLEHLYVGLPNYSAEECPFAIPLRISQRDSFRTYLAEKRIYCAVHWPFDGFKGDEREWARTNARELISLPIDQRYDREHMDYLLSVIQNQGAF